MRSLTAHHNIEEMYFFPLLAAKMPEFSSGGKGSSNRQAAELLQQHKEIHAGMDVFEDYLRRCRNRETELELSVLKEKMDSVSTYLYSVICSSPPPTGSAAELADSACCQSGARCCGSTSTRRSRRSAPRT